MAALPPMTPSCFEVWKDYVINNIPSSSLYPHQQAALHAIRTFWDEGGRGATPVAMPPTGEMRTPPCVISFPTGTGKSAVVALAPYVIGAKRVLVIAPDKTIRDQLAKDMSNSQPFKDKAILKRGVVTLADMRRRGGPLPSTLSGKDVRSANLNEELAVHELVVTNAHKFTARHGADGTEPTWQTLASNFFDVIIVDEAHHFPASFWSKVVLHFRDSKVLFFTATPYRSDGKLVLAAGEPPDGCCLTRQEAVQRGIIRRVIPQQIGDEPESDDEDGSIMVEAFKETIDEIKRLLEKQELEHPFPDLPAAAGAESSSPQKHVAMACTWKVVNAKRIAKIANDRGLRARVVASKEPNKQNIAQFKAGSVKLLVVCNMLLEGFDHAPCSVAAVMNRISSPIRFSQFVGRAVRVVRGKNNEHIGAPAYCVHHAYFKQSTMFENYEDDTLLGVAIGEAEEKYKENADADEGDGDDEVEDDHEDDEDGAAFLRVINFGGEEEEDDDDGSDDDDPVMSQQDPEE